MVMKSGEFFEQIKQGELEGCYLLHGEEEYAKDRALEQLIGSMDETLRDFNLNSLEQAEAEEVIEACEMLPVMVDKRIVLVRDDSFFALSDGKAKIIMDYLPQQNPMTCLVFVLRGKADARKGLYKAIDKMGNVVNFERYNENEAARWAVSFAKKQGVTLSGSLAMRLVGMTSREMGRLAGETQKLCDFAGEGGSITAEMIEESVAPNMKYTVFEMLEHFVAGRLGQGLLMLDDTIKREGAGALISMIAFFATRIQSMWIGRLALDRGESAAQAQKSIGGNSYAAKKSLEAARRFSTEELSAALEELANLDYGIKRGQVKGRETFERILLETFGKQNPQ